MTNDYPNPNPIAYDNTAYALSLIRLFLLIEQGTRHVVDGPVREKRYGREGTRKVVGFIAYPIETNVMNNDPNPIA